MSWPVAGLGPIARAKVLAAMFPSAAWAEGVLDAPYENTWSWVTDFERSVPVMDTTVARVRVQTRGPIPGEPGVERVRMRATARFGVTLPFDVRVEDGFCLMRGLARMYLVVMAAIPEDRGQRTRYLHMEAVPIPGTRLLRPIIRREVESDFANLTRLASSGF